MDAYVFRLLAAELAAFLPGARVEKIHSPTSGILTFSLFQHGTKQQLVWRSGRRNPGFYLTNHKLPNPPVPTTDVMRLRKYMGGHRLGGVINNWPERTLYINLPSSVALNHQLWLTLSIHSGAQLTPHTPTLPTIQLPDPATIPELFPIRNGDTSIWRAYPLLTPALRKTLVALDEPDQCALIADLADEVASVDNGCLYSYSGSAGDTLLSAWPLPKHPAKATSELLLYNCLADAARGQCAMLETARQALEPHLVRDLAAIHGKDYDIACLRANKRHHRLLAKLDEEKQRLEGMAQMQTAATALQGYLWQVHPEQKLAEIVIPAEHSPTGQAFPIVLNPRFTLTENMTRLFHAAARGKRGLRILEQRLQNVASQALHQVRSHDHPSNPHASLPTKLQKKQYQQMRLIQQFYASNDQFCIWRGRSAEGNHALLQLAAPHDVWMHIQDGPSAHVIVRRISSAVPVPDATLREAAILCANKSWRREDSKAEVTYALVKDVKNVKRAKPGSVTIQKAIGTLLVTPDTLLENQLHRVESTAPAKPSPIVKKDQRHWST